MNNIYNYTQEKLNKILASENIKESKSKFLYKGIYRDLSDNFEDIPYIPSDYFNRNFEIKTPQIVETLACDDSVKFLIKLFDGNFVEAVVMRHDYGLSVCISTQLGCNMGCVFCQSGRMKKIRNLETWEMVGQVIAVSKALGERVKNVVLMGIGEPFDNYDNVIDFIDIICNDNGLAIGKRHITVSTCGLAPKIIEFANEKSNVNLAISLHAPDDEIRNKLMPINKAYPLNDLFDALSVYNKRISFEYLMLKDINDSDECAYKLAELVSGFQCFVNLIPYNETENIGLKKSPIDRINKFFDILKSKNVLVTVRREFGGELKAACGQLRAERELNF